MGVRVEENLGFPDIHQVAVSALHEAAHHFHQFKARAQRAVNKAQFQPDMHADDRDMVKVWEKMNAKRFDKIMLKTKTGTPMTQPPPCNAGLALTPTKIKRLSGGRTEHDKCVWASENMLYIVVGGLGSILGSILGPVVLVALPELLRAFAEYRQLFFALVLLLTLIFMPQGIAGAVRGYFLRRFAAPPTPVVAAAGAVKKIELQSRHPRASSQEVLLEVKDLTLSFGGLKALNGAHLSMRGGAVKSKP